MSKLAVIAPPMPAGAAFPRWDHYCVSPAGELAQVLAEAGDAGWEMVSMAVNGASLFACFKRPRAARPQ